MFQKSKGFTLIELLIVLALLAVVLAGAYNLFSFMFKGWNITEDEVFSLQEARLRMEQLGNEVRNAKPLANELIGVVVEDNGTTLYLGPEGQDRIRYKLNLDGWLYRTIADKDGNYQNKDTEQFIKLAKDLNNKPFSLDEKTKYLKIFWQIELNNGSIKELKGEFAIRNGLLKEEKK